MITATPQTADFALTPPPDLPFRPSWADMSGNWEPDGREWSREVGRRVGDLTDGAKPAALGSDHTVDVCAVQTLGEDGTVSLGEAAQLVERIASNPPPDLPGPWWATSGRLAMSPEPGRDGPGPARVS
jgi:hypothetical protein